jgi:hypothetical protein
VYLTDRASEKEVRKGEETSRTGWTTWALSGFVVFFWGSSRGLNQNGTRKSEPLYFQCIYPSLCLQIIHELLFSYFRRHFGLCVWFLGSERVSFRGYAVDPSVWL